MKSINREILSLAIPSIITNITTPLLALMDVAIVGHMGAPVYIAAIAIGGTIFNMIYWLFAFLRMGTSGLSAQAHGADNGDQLDVVLARGSAVALISAALVIILSPFIAKIAFLIMDVSADVRDMADTYFRILIWGAPAVLMTYTFSGWCLGRKNTKTPMWVSFIINITNILVSVILVFVFNLKIEGVATGTLSAQWIGAISLISIVVHKYRPRIVSLSRIFLRDEIKRFFSVNIDIFLRTCCLIAVTVWFTRIGSEQGVTMLAVNTLMMQFFVMFSYFMDGFAFAGESLCGNDLGASDKTALLASIKALIMWGARVALLFTIIYLLFGEEILRLLSEDVKIIDMSSRYIHWVTLIPFAGFLAFTWDGIYIGITQTGKMLQSMVFSMVIYFIMYFLLFPIIGNHGLWIAFLCYLLSRGIYLQLSIKKILTRLFSTK